MKITRIQILGILIMLFLVSSLSGIEIAIAAGNSDGWGHDIFTESSTYQSEAYYPNYVLYNDNGAESRYGVYLYTRNEAAGDKQWTASHFAASLRIKKITLFRLTHLYTDYYWEAAPSGMFYLSNWHIDWEGNSETKTHGWSLGVSGNGASFSYDYKLQSSTGPPKAVHESGTYYTNGKDFRRIGYIETEKRDDTVDYMLIGVLINSDIAKSKDGYCTSSGSYTYCYYIENVEFRLKVRFLDIGSFGWTFVMATHVMYLGDGNLEGNAGTSISSIGFQPGVVDSIPS